MRSSTMVMIGFAVVFGLLAVFLAQTWLNGPADARLKSLEAQPSPDRTMVVAKRPLRLGDELSAAALREVPWPQNALPAGAFGKISRASVMILSALPIGLFIVIQFVSPEFYGAVWHEYLTKLLLCGALVWMGIGNLIMFRMVNFRI